MNAHVVVLTDGGQDPGLGTLINSLVRNGFRGTLWAGWRGTGAELFERLPAAVRAQIDARLVPLETERPLTYYKPDFIEQVWALAGEDATAIVYLDCDVVVGCEWAFMEAWVHSGLALVQDLPARSVGADHPLRRAWEGFMAAAGLSPAREVDAYYNAGFVGIPASARAILGPWRELGRALEGAAALRDPGHDPHFVRGVRSGGTTLVIPAHVSDVMRPFFLEDQDALNMAVMATSVELCTMGPDGMGFTASRTPILLHALGPEKPWAVSYVRRVIRRGRGPSYADDMWWRYADAPIPVAHGPEYSRRRLAWRTAKVLERLISR